MDLPFRPRRLRRTAPIRDLVAESTLAITDFVQPIFIIPGQNLKEPISTLPGLYSFSPDTAAEYCFELASIGLNKFLLFGTPKYKDHEGSAAWAPDGVIQEALRLIREVVPEALLIPDLCFCEYTSLGHCGVVTPGKMVPDNDHSLEPLLRQALSLSDAGADGLAPSGMLDGMIGYVRKGLDEKNHQDVFLMSYSVKYASSFYGPFRDAVKIGINGESNCDRSTHQMDYRNSREALREAHLDESQGADIIMVKPALPYLDIIAQLSMRTTLPIAAYQVSGEYASLYLAATAGMFNFDKIMLETLSSIKRAGASIIISYYSERFCKTFKA